MSRRRAKNSGWAAFDPNKHVTDNETDDDPFPSISSTNIGTLPHRRNSSRYGDHTGKSFSSVLTYSPSFPSLIATEDPVMENSHSKQTTSKYVAHVVPQIYEKLKVLHPWANDNLIEDIVAAVDSDIDKASTLLSDMAPPGRLEEKKEAEFIDNIQELRLDTSNSLMVENKDMPVENSAKELIHDNVALRLMIDMSMVPVEPEWEDDDVYRVHRKEAIRAMRVASRLSKAASEAYLRRDHVAAHEISKQAQQEWSNAEKLHANAAKEILAIRNCENDDWTLDLHGLHATEAVQVLLEHLLKLESQVSRTGKSDRHQLLSRSRLLEVITGKGSHSRGEAALPVAVKSFLSEKGYHHYEARTGVITVQPKFRQKSAALSNTL